ncbi:putative transporter [Aggregatibacter actinomycetemcomitans]|uniref:putative transporter n=1 Tax=Aggregatibacter actinomycetemcomitans TaxID=714 RepID=UPI0021CA4D59|nr:putative transporter [Aggregatibacter actinomycetemcomitans]UXM98359.1 putative transporter [Aggregatibacter actinomycetemcomitans]
MSDIAITTSLLALVAVIGLWIGHWKIKGVGFGVGGVLFGGIIVAHFTNEYGLKLDMHTLHFVQEFGLILFVYTIGIQVGPGFFSSLRRSGLKLNGFAFLIVLLGGLTVVVIHKFAGVPLDIILGIYSGAVTNTPSLGAGQQILSELGFADANTTMGTAYAMAYPFGICGILLCMWLIRLAFKVKVDDEERNFQHESGQDKESLGSINVKVTNKNLDGLRLADIPGFESHDVVCSRLKRGDDISVPDTEIFPDDVLHLVGETPALKKMRLVIGEELDLPISNISGEIRAERVVVTSEKVLGKKIKSLGIHQKYGVVISRLNRAGVELVPTANTSLQFGDVLHMVGRTDVLNNAISVIGNAEQKLQQVQMLPVFIGIGLGVLLGSIPFYIPGFPVALKLGLAGGPLVVALILARIGSVGKLYWFMPPSANLALREIGIVLFLAVVGLKSGGSFLDTLLNGSGLEWMGYGVIITLVPLLITGIVARLYSKLNYLSLCGVLAGSMTDPPALAFANAIKEESGAAALSYATVYPLAMFLRIISPQLLALLLWSFA